MHVTTGRYFDPSRNTSRQAAVPPDALPDLLEHLAANRGAEWYRWIVAGQPPLTPAEYAALHSGRRPSSSPPAGSPAIAAAELVAACQLDLEAT